MGEAPPPYTMCDPYGTQGWMPRNITVAWCCLVVNIGFVWYFYRLHVPPAEAKDARDLPRGLSRHHLLRADHRERNGTSGSQKPSWGFGGKYYLYQESVKGILMIVPTLVWFYVYHGQGGEGTAYACAWNQGLYGFPLLFLQSALVPLIVYGIGSTARFRYYKAFDRMDIKKTDTVLILPGYRGGYVPEVAKRVPEGHVFVVDAYGTRWQPEPIDWMEANAARTGMSNVSIHSVEDWSELPFQTGQFDVVVSTFLYNNPWVNQPFETLSERRGRAIMLLREIRRVLRPGGSAHAIDMWGRTHRAEVGMVAAGFQNVRRHRTVLCFALHPERLVSGTVAAGAREQRLALSRKVGRSFRTSSAPPTVALSRTASMVLPWMTTHEWETHLGFRLFLMVPLIAAYVAGVVLTGIHWGDPDLRYLPFLPFFNMTGQAIIIGLWPVPLLIYWIFDELSTLVNMDEVSKLDVVRSYLKQLMWLPVKVAVWTCFVFWPSWLIDYYLAQSLTQVGIYACQIVINFSLWMLALVIMHYSNKVIEVRRDFKQRHIGEQKRLVSMKPQYGFTRKRATSAGPASGGDPFLAYRSI